MSVSVSAKFCAKNHTHASTVTIHTLFAQYRNTAMHALVSPRMPQ